MMFTKSFRAVCGWIALFAALCAPLPAMADYPGKLMPAYGWDIHKQGAFPVSLLVDDSGNVWVGTEGNGLWEYDVTKKDWTQFTTKDGLGDDTVYALAVDSMKRIWAGHLNHGVSVYNGSAWQNYGLLDGPIGDRVFSIAVSPTDGDVWIATEMGLARYSEKRRNWDYYTRASGLPSDQIKKVSVDQKGVVSAETQCDGVATAGPDDNYGKWHLVTSGTDCGGANKQDEAAVDRIERGTANAIGQPANLAPFYVIKYDPAFGGLFHMDAKITNPQSAAGPAAPQPLPAAAPTPTAKEADALTAAISRYTNPITPGEAFFLADDWRTGGDWIGRYGTAYAKLCGMADGDQDYPQQPGFDVTLQVGPNHRPGASGPVAFHDDETSDDVRSLYDPTLGHRRDAQDNDLSYDTDAYPLALDGPDLWARVAVPNGVHCLSLYFYNSDAHAKPEARDRDYLVSIVPALDDDVAVAAEPALAHTRVTDFWGGVYKQFIVCGPARFVVRIGRNHSPGTELRGLFIDRVSGSPSQPVAPLPGFAETPFGPPDVPPNAQLQPLAASAISLWDKLDGSLDLRAALPLEIPLHIWAYRAAVAGGAPPEMLAHFRFEISIWTPDDRKEFDKAMKAAHDALMK